MIDYKTDQRSNSILKKISNFRKKIYELFLKKRNRSSIGFIIYHLPRPIINFILSKKNPRILATGGRK